MFEILPPACIMEKDVLITLKWQLVGRRQLREEYWSGVIVSGWTVVVKGKTLDTIFEWAGRVQILHELRPASLMATGQRLSGNKSTRVALCVTFQWVTQGKSQRCNPYLYNSSMARNGWSTQRKTIPEREAEIFLFTPYTRKWTAAASSTVI